MRISKKEGNRSGAISLVVAVLGLVGAVLGFVGILTAQYLANVNNERLAPLKSRIRRTPTKETCATKPM